MDRLSVKTTDGHTRFLEMPTDSAREMLEVLWLSRYGLNYEMLDIESRKTLKIRMDTALNRAGLK